MSYITPRTYRELANTLGDAYWKVKMAFHTMKSDDAESKDDGTAYGYAKYVVDSIVSANDINSGDAFEHKNVQDPSGSIASDLGTASVNFAASLADASNASKLSAPYFAAILQKLNSHVVKRTDNAADPTKAITNIRKYYDYCALNVDYVGVPEMSLHSNNGVSIAQNCYFTYEFVDLCKQIGVDLTTYTYQTYVS